MILDLDEVDETSFAADICIVGTGAAGMALASRLFGSGRSVIFAESGGHGFEPQVQALYRSEIAGLCLDGAHIGRTRQLGGSTNCWGGQLLPLDALDFAERSWVEHSGWPLRKDSLDAYYASALSFFDSDRYNFDTDLFELFGVQSPFDSTAFRYHFSQWTPQPNLRLRYQADFAQSENVKLLLHANLTGIHLDAGRDRIAYLELVNQRLRGVRVEAQTYILCLGGIETARVLLSSNHQLPEGVGNTAGLVGRYFQDHPMLHIGDLLPTSLERVQNTFGSKELDGRLYTPKFSLTPERQRELGVLNASASFYFTEHVLLRRRMALNFVRSLAAGGPMSRDVAGHVSKLLWRSLQVLSRKALGRPRKPCSIYVITEQEPSAASRITLGEQRDRYGVPRSRIEWRLSDRTARTFQAVAALVAEECRSGGLGTVGLLPHLERVSAGWSIFPNESFHHMGSTRMGRTPHTGVVDADCRVFGVDNLYVVSSSVFPTGGHSNPTLTIVALAFRLLDHLFPAAPPTDRSSPAG